MKWMNNSSSSSSTRTELISIVVQSNQAVMIVDCVYLCVYALEWWNRMYNLLIVSVELFKQTVEDKQNNKEILYSMFLL